MILDKLTILVCPILQHHTLSNLSEKAALECLWHGTGGKPLHVTAPVAPAHLIGTSLLNNVCFRMPLPNLMKEGQELEQMERAIDRGIIDDDEVSISLLA